MYKKMKKDFNKNKILGNEEFIKRSKLKHGDKYDYSLVEYENSKTKVKIICPIHGEFEQAAVSHVRGKGCKQCGTNTVRNKLKFDINKFIDDAKKTHGDKYNYSLVEYSISHTKVLL
jgi:hypothetical protein